MDWCICRAQGNDISQAIVWPISVYHAQQSNLVIDNLLIFLILPSQLHTIINLVLWIVQTHKTILYLHTCVFPPVTSCMTDLDNDADALKHKNAPMPFIMPKARNSYTSSISHISCISYIHWLTFNKVVIVQATYTVCILRQLYGSITCYI